MPHSCIPLQIVARAGRESSSPSCNMDHNSYHELPPLPPAPTNTGLRILTRAFSFPFYSEDPADNEIGRELLVTDDEVQC